MSNPILDLVRNYTNVDNFVYGLVPRDGIDLSGLGASTVAGSGEPLEMRDVLQEALGLALPEGEVDNVLADHKFDRGEALGLFASFGNKSDVQVTEAEIGAMTEKMEKWGLDASNPDERSMIVGVAKFDKLMLEKQSVLKVADAKMSEHRGDFQEAAKRLEDSYIEPDDFEVETPSAAPSAVPLPSAG